MACRMPLAMGFQCSCFEGSSVTAHCEREEGGETCRETVAVRGICCRNRSVWRGGGAICSPRTDLWRARRYACREGQAEPRLRAIRSADLSDFYALELQRRPSLDDPHRSMATRTSPDYILTISSERRCRRLTGKTIPADGQQAATFSIGEPAEIANMRKALGQYVL